MEKPPKLELDERWFTALASTPTAVITRHVGGSLTVWRLEWRERGCFPSGFEAEAWKKYMDSE